MRNLPHHAFSHNQTWFEPSLIAQDLLTWMKLTCLEGELQNAEPKRLRHRLLHVAGKLVRYGRRTRLRLQADWPWAKELLAAFHKLRSLPSPRLTTATKHPVTKSTSRLARTLAPARNRPQPAHQRAPQTPTAPN